MFERDYLCANAKDENQPKGQLNPDWVCWLMGIPIGFTSLEPIDELVWLDWSVDPADVESSEMWTTPCQDDTGMRKKKYAQGGSALSFQVGKAERKWPTPREGNPGSRPNKKGGKILAEEAKKIPSQGIIPRVAVGIKDRVNRLKGIGNAQVPQVAATAWEILN